MRRAWSVLPALLLVGAVPLSADWQASHSARLREAVAYRQALVDLREAEMKVAQYERIYVPYLEVATSGQYGVSIRDGVLQPSSPSAELRFENLLGADLAFEVPLALGGEPAVDLGDPSVTLSRKLFDESRAGLLKARAALIRARASVDKAAFDVRITLVTDVLDAYRSVRVAESHRRNLAVLERLAEVTRSETDRRAVERRILQARRAILQADEALEAIGPDVQGEVEALYAETLRLVEGWVRAMPERGTERPASAELEALGLELEAAERERALAFLPYVPNPTMSASLTYLKAEQRLSWRLSFTLSYDVIDRGERAAANLVRREGPDLKRLRIQSAERALERSVASAWRALEILDIDRRIQTLDVEDAREELELWRALRERGFATEEAVVALEIDVAVAELDAVKVEHDYVKQQLKLLSYYGSMPKG